MAPRGATPSLRMRVALPILAVGAIGCMAAAPGDEVAPTPAPEPGVVVGAGAWGAPTPLGVAADGRRARLLATGRVAVLGSSATAAGQGAAVLLDPATGGLTTVDPPAGPDGAPREMAHTGTALLPDGTLVVAGGAGRGTAHVLTFDPVGLSWTDHGPIGPARRDPLVVALADGRAVIYAGEGPGAGDVGVLEAPGLDGSRSVTRHERERDPRRARSAVARPDGDILLSGPEPRDAAILDTRTFRFHATDETPAPAPAGIPLPTGDRLIDAVEGAIVLPDGRLLGLGDAGYATVAPAYLRTGAARPRVAIAGREVAAGGTLGIQVDAVVASARLMAPGALDGAPDPVDLGVAQDGAAVALTVPSGTPPGRYVLSVVARGVPSMGRWVSVGIPHAPLGADDDDLTPPGAAAVDATGADGTPVVLALTEAVDAGTLGAVVVAPASDGRSGRRAARVVPTEADTHLAVHPAAPLVPGRRYRVTIPAGLADVAGNAAPGPIAWTFTARGAERAPEPATRPGPQPPTTPDPGGPLPRPPVADGPTGPERVLARAGFDAGLAGVSGLHAAAADRITAVPVEGGGGAGRFEVRHGDRWRGSSGSRAEVTLPTGEGEGAERSYAWRTMFPAGFPRTSEGFQIVTQWHADAGGTQPMLVVFAAGDRIGFKTVETGADLVPAPSEVHWTAPIERGRWHAFRLRVRWAADGGAGWVELWHDGRRVVDRTAVATLIPGHGAYMKLGLYRSDTIVPTGVVYHDAVVITGR